MHDWYCMLTEKEYSSPVAKKCRVTASLSADGIASLIVVSLYVIKGATIRRSSSNVAASIRTKFM